MLDACSSRGFLPTTSRPARQGSRTWWSSLHWRMRNGCWPT